MSEFSGTIRRPLERLVGRVRRMIHSECHMFDCFHYCDGLTRCHSEYLYFNAVWVDEDNDDGFDDTGMVFWIERETRNSKNHGSGSFRMF